MNDEQTHLELPSPHHPYFRYYCNGIAEELSRNWRFKWQVIGFVVIMLVTVAATIGGLIGLSLVSFLKDQRQEFQRRATQEIADAKESVEKEIRG